MVVSIHQRISVKNKEKGLSHLNIYKIIIIIIIIIIFFSIYTLSDLGVSSNLIGSLSCANEQYSLNTKWIMRDPDKHDKMLRGVN